jgi:hypothetical protein
MIGKTLHNRSFLATLKYVGRKGSVHLGGNTLGLTPREMAGEFEMFASLRPNRSKPVVHIIGALAPTDWVSDSQMYEIACRHLQEQGYGNCLFSIWRHVDGTTDHYHVITCEVDARGKTVCQSHERWRTKRTSRKIEIEFGLEIMGNTKASIKENYLSSIPMPEPGGLDIEIPTVTTVVADTFAREIQAALPGCLSFGDLAQTLASRGMSMVPQLHKETGEMYGLGYRMEHGPLAGSYLSGSKIPGNFSPSKLIKKHGLSFDPSRDLPAIRCPTPPTPIVAAPRPSVVKPRRKKKGDRSHARHNRKSSKFQPVEPGQCPWLPHGISPETIRANGPAPEGTRLVRSLLAHSQPWAPTLQSPRESIFPGDGTSPWRVARIDRKGHEATW